MTGTKDTLIYRHCPRAVATSAPRALIGLGQLADTSLGHFDVRAFSAGSHAATATEADPLGVLGARARIARILPPQSGCNPVGLAARQRTQDCGREGKLSHGQERAFGSE